MTINTCYEDLLRDVLENGEMSPDRTGVGTRSVFGRQMRFDLADGFPLVTTKKVFLRGAIEELLWFLSGDTNVNTLIDKNVHIWDEWRKPFSTRFSRHVKLPRSAAMVISKLCNPHYMKRMGGDILAQEKTCADKDSFLWRSWVSMVEYAQDRPYMYLYKPWLFFENFAKDAATLPHYWYAQNTTTHTGDSLVVVPSYRPTLPCAPGVTGLQRGSYFAPDVSIWGTPYERNQCALYGASTGDPGCRYPIIEDGDLGAVYGAQWRSWNGDIDQIKNVVKSIKGSPYSRRHIVSAWNVGELDNMALPPCHTLFQFHVRPTGHLDCQLYQRSADVFLGLPFNIASYALLTMLVAQETGLTPGEFVWSGGDVHLYNNHIEQAREQLSREPRQFPVMSISEGKSIFGEGDSGYCASDFTLSGYNPHPAISASVAV